MFRGICTEISSYVYKYIYIYICICRYVLYNDYREPGDSTPSEVGCKEPLTISRPAEAGAAGGGCSTHLVSRP